MSSELLKKLIKSDIIFTVDFKICNYDLKKAVKEKNLYQHFKKSNTLNCDLTNVIPSREEFVKIYQYVKKLKMGLFQKSQLLLE